MDYGAHLPLIEFDGVPRTLDGVCTYARRANELGYRFLCANDHLLFPRPWLDGPAALAATLEASGDMTLATTIALPVIRGPIQMAKLFASLDVLSRGRVVAGVGPGSSAVDYAAVGLDFDERWKRFDESVQALRALFRHEPFSGNFYETGGIVLDPKPAQPGGPPIWIASWGSAAGMRRVVRLGDGWLASGYNTSPAVFGDRGAALPPGFPRAIGTMWLYVTDSRRDADRILEDVLSPMLRRPAETLRALALPIGSPEQCAENLSAYADAGAQAAFVWPLADDVRQLEAFRERVVPLVSAG